MLEEKAQRISDGYSSFIHLSRYSRWLEEENRRETWPETVHRYVSFFKGKYEHDQVVCGKLDEAEKYILNKDVMPSMRCLMTAGKALERDHVAGFNCSAVAIDHVRAFDEILYILMCGTGVGFSVERQYVNKLPEVAECMYGTDTTIVVDDSKIGWAKAYRELIQLLYAGQIPKWDVSKVRNAGARLKTFGGRASGPKPLVDLFKFTIDVFRKAEGRKLTSVECHDIVCKIAEVVVVGGVRRSALISLSNLSDDRMRDAKSGQWWMENPQRALANNSAVYTEKPELATFLKEWVALHTSKSGERGIINRAAFDKQAEWYGRRDPYPNGFLTNPCFAAGTIIPTKDGFSKIEHLLDEPVEVWDGERWVEVQFRVTAKDQEVWTLTLQDGSKVTSTPYHTYILEDGRRVQMQDLELGDKLKIANTPEVHYPLSKEDSKYYAYGFCVGDGTASGDKPILWIYEPKEVCIPTLISSINNVPSNSARKDAAKEVGVLPAGEGRFRISGLSRKKALTFWCTEAKEKLPLFLLETRDVGAKTNFLAGLFDADGTASDTPNGFMYQLSSIHEEMLRGVQMMLKSLGIYSTLRKCKESGVKDFGEARGGKYEVKSLWRLTLNQTAAIKFGEIVPTKRLPSFSHKVGKYNVKPRWNTVIDIAPAGVEEEVYCCTVPTNNSFAIGNGILVGNCGEIILRSGQFCNLTEVVIRDYDTWESLHAKAEIASFLGTLQASLTNFRYLRNSWKKNTEEESLLGVSLTGVMDNPLTYVNTSMLQENLDELRQAVVETNQRWAARIGIPASVATTANKPSGTVSQLVDCASGIHPRYSNFYVRRVRQDKKDPLSLLMKDMGIPCEDDKFNSNAYVFSFPMKAPENAVTTASLSALEHLKLWKTYKEFWCEHNPSVTISYSDDEFMDIGAWVWKEWDSVGGISFLPRSDHVYEQAPYEAITREEWEKLVEEMPEMDFQKLNEYEFEDNVVNTKELACVAGHCEI